MSFMNAIDTNILIYSVDQKEPAKQAKAHQLLRQLVTGTEQTILLWQVLTESTRQLRRWKDKGELTDAEFALHVQAFRTLFPLVLPIEGVLDRALDLGRRFSLSFWDSMILGACKEAGLQPCTRKTWVRRHPSMGFNWSTPLFDPPTWRPRRQCPSSEHLAQESSGCKAQNQTDKHTWEQTEE